MPRDVNATHTQIHTGEHAHSPENGLRAGKHRANPRAVGPFLRGGSRRAPVAVAAIVVDTQDKGAGLWMLRLTVEEPFQDLGRVLPLLELAGPRKSCTCIMHGYCKSHFVASQTVWSSHLDQNNESKGIYMEIWFCVLLGSAPSFCGPF